MRRRGRFMRIGCRRDGVELFVSILNSFIAKLWVGEVGTCLENGMELSLMRMERGGKEV